MLSASALFVALWPLLALLVLALMFFLMRPRRFYLVRHGETLMNAEHIKQGEEGALSPKGRHQADKVGAYLAQFKIQRIISSTYPRARETTEIINTHLNVPVIYSPLLVERRNPSEVVSKSRDDTDVKRIVDQIDLTYHEDDYRFSDEENFVDLQKRARKCLNLLARQGAREMCVVTHHVFPKCSSPISCTAIGSTPPTSQSFHFLISQIMRASPFANSIRGFSGTPPAAGKSFPITSSPTSFLCRNCATHGVAQRIQNQKWLTSMVSVQKPHAMWGFFYFTRVPYFTL